MVLKNDMPQLGKKWNLPCNAWHHLSDDEEQGEDSNNCNEKQQLENNLTNLIIQLLISEPLSVGEYIRCRIWRRGRY